jgi:NAD(P)-dependent dehydrogenase (short-subunit alcohol dehydrogenase family)
MLADARTAIVTGASRGIGREVALRLAELGYDIALLAKENSEPVAQQIRAMKRRAFSSCVDVRSSADVNSAIGATVQELGPVDVLINCAGVAFFGGVDHCSEDEWLQTIDVNLNGYFRMIKAVLPAMKERKQGSIINMSSVWGQQGAQSMVAYAASKYGIEGLTASFALEAQSAGIKVTSIVLDKVDTDFRDGMTTHVVFSPEQRCRMLSPGDVADTVAYVLACSARCLPESITLKAWLF